MKEECVTAHISTKSRNWYLKHEQMHDFLAGSGPNIKALTGKCLRLFPLIEVSLGVFYDLVIDSLIYVY